MLTSCFGVAWTFCRSRVAPLNDKLLQRQALETAGVPVPHFTAINDDLDSFEIDRLCETLSFPMLLKPRDGTASHDIVSITDKDELITIRSRVWGVPHA